MAPRGGLLTNFLDASISRKVDLLLTNHGNDAIEMKKAEKQLVVKPAYHNYLKPKKIF